MLLPAAATDHPKQQQAACTHTSCSHSALVPPLVSLLSLLLGVLCSAPLVPRLPSLSGPRHGQPDFCPLQICASLAGPASQPLHGGLPGLPAHEVVPADEELSWPTPLLLQTVP